MSSGGRPASDLLRQAEEALAGGESERAFDLLAETVARGVDRGELHRLATALALVGRFQSRHAEVLGWIEAGLAGDIEPAAHAALLWARVSVCRQLDVGRVLDLVEEALAEAQAVGDEQAFAGVLAHAAFAGYRRGDVRAANEYADRAAERAFSDPIARFQALRAQMFAAVARGDLEQALSLSSQARAIAGDLDRIADAANEANNQAEVYLELGFAEQACECAEAARSLAAEAGHRGVEMFAGVLGAIATAERGDVDAAIVRFEQLAAGNSGDMLAIDLAVHFSYWLLERGNGGDTSRAGEVAEAAIARAIASGATHRLTALGSNLARAYARAGRDDDARGALENARRAAAHAEPTAQALLALGIAEVLADGDPKRQVALGNARARMLRGAEQRDDPRAYLTRVRLHRQLLELSGGVPPDLPVAN